MTSSPSPLKRSRSGDDVDIRRRGPGAAQEAQELHKRPRSDVNVSNIIQHNRRRTTPPLSPSPSPSPSPQRSRSGDDIESIAVQLVRDGVTLDALSRTYRQVRQRGDLTSHSNWYPHQEGTDPKYLCYRPQYAIPDVPVILLFEPLSKFAVNLKTIAITDLDLSMAQMFWDDVHSVDYVNDHKQKVFCMVTDINNYCPAANFIPSYALRDGSTIDGVGMLGQDHCIWLEFKSELGKSGDPYFQVLDYAFRSAASGRASSLAHQTYGVALCVAGPHLQVLAVTIVGGKVWADPLGIVECYGAFEALEATARVWASVRQFLSDYKPLMKFTSDPVPWCVREYPDLQRLDARTLLYTYKNEEGEKELAKFVQSYCDEAHTAWMPYVPELRGIEAIVADKWRLVRMEYLSQEKGWQPAAEILKGATDEPDHIAKIKAFIVQMVQKGHTHGFVHGDMRLPNILLRKGDEKEADGFPRYDVRLLDFDWSGVRGVAKYPRKLNKEVEWPPGAIYGALIAQEHDMWFADHLEQQL